MKFINKCIRSNVDIELLSNCTNLIQKKEDELARKSKIFSLLGNEVRLKIVTLLLDYKSLCVCDLSDILNMGQSPISQHLRKLKDGKLIESRRDGMTIFYSICKPIKQQLKKLLEG